MKIWQQRNAIVLRRLLAEELLIEVQRLVQIMLELHLEHLPRNLLVELEHVTN